jgi:pimeloyl-ACP methyl ester carboxylesterase
MNEITGVAAGVPYVALPPADPTRPAPMIAVWHLMDAPASEEAMAAAVPMRGLPAWRVYFGLPMTGKRALPDGEYFRLASEDAVMNVYGPQTQQGADEFPAALARLREELPIADGTVGIAGGSSGSMIAYEVTARAEVPIFAAAFISPVTQLAPLIAANERRYDVTFTWTEDNRAVADRYDYVRRADEINVPATLVVGEHDDIAIREPAQHLHKVSDIELVTIPGMRHEFADENGPLVDAELVRWFSQYVQG